MPEDLKFSGILSFCFNALINPKPNQFLISTSYNLLSPFAEMHY
jgi:hypothetical protein